MDNNELIVNNEQTWEECSDRKQKDVVGLSNIDGVCPSSVKSYIEETTMYTVIDCGLKIP